MPTITITEDQNGKRVDHILTDHMELSRSQIQKLIKRQSILLNNKPCKPKSPVQTGDVLFYPEVEQETPATKKGRTPLLDVIYQDDDVFVINKPARLIVHQVNDQDTEHTLVDGLLEIFPEIADVGDDPTRPGIVHRLDKDVSGVMVVAKTQEMFENLKHQFQTRTVEKEYLALVYGELPKDFDEIKLRIARSRARGRMVARPESQEGKDAITQYDVIERLKKTTYVRVKILTGRTHQIRVHFQALDHPIVGDKLYKKKRMKNIKPIKLDRIFLHARKLTIKLSNKKQRSFEVDLPHELKEVLNNER